MVAKKLRLTAFGICALMLIGGCSSSDGSTKGAKDGDSKKDPLASVAWTDESGKSAVTVDAKDNSFGPQYVTVSVGTKVTFDNRGRNPHNVVPVDKGAFDTVEVPAFQPGDSAERTFDEPGEYAFYCSLHGTPTAGMTGGIKVVG